MAHKLYYEDSFLNKFTAQVLQCIPDEKKGFAIILSQTAFYPEGGGQPCDKGCLIAGDTVFDIYDVREKEGEIFHYCKAPVPTGITVCGEIDFERRFDLMQQHTGEHILSGVIHQVFGYNNIGFHLGETEITVDFDGPLASQDIQLVMETANNYVWQNQPIKTEFPQNLQELEYRSKKELTGQVRIVSAGNADMCACCGTHTKTTAQAGPIIIANFSAYKGGTRIVMHCGKRAVKYLMQRNSDCLAISHLLSLPLEKVPQGVQARLDEIGNLKMQLAKAQAQLMEFWVAQAVVQNKIIFLEKEGLSSAQVQQLCQMASEKAPIACVLSGQSDAPAKICIISNQTNTTALGKAITAQFCGKGGGKPGLFQGFVEKPTGLLEFLLQWGL